MKCVVCGKDLEECGCEGFDTEAITLEQKMEYLKSIYEEEKNGERTEI